MMTGLTGEDEVLPPGLLLASPIGQGPRLTTLGLSPLSVLEAWIGRH